MILGDFTNNSVVQTENLEKFPTCVDGELTGSIEEK
jgi:hypothetical protein